MFKKNVRGFWPHESPGVLPPGSPPVIQKFFGKSQNFPNSPNYFLCDEYNKWEVVV